MRWGSETSPRWLRASRGAAWLVLSGVALACGGGKATVANASPDVDAQNVTADVDSGEATDALALDAPADVSAEVAADVAPLDVTPDVPDAGPPTGCPPDPTPTWSGIVAQSKPFQGAPVPGDDCAYPGWTSPPNQTAAEWTRVTVDLGLENVGRADMCLIWQDVTGDGLEDLVSLLQPTTPTGARTLLIASGTAAGGLNVQTYPTTLHAEPWDCGIGDLDQDGHLELTLATNAGVSILSLDPAHFGLDTTAQFGTFNVGARRTVTTMDYDSDGDIDLYVTDAVNFTNGFTCMAADNDYWMCCVPPYDLACMQGKKGQPDVYTCCDPKALSGTQYLFRNDGGKFPDASKAVTLQIGFQETVSPFDVDRDGILDFFGGEDFGRHGWFRHQDDQFTYHGTEWGMRPYAHLMGSVVADFDLDHQLELVIADIGADTIYGPGPLAFQDLSVQWGLWKLTRNTVTWAELAVDLDNDGWLDLATVASLLALDGLMLPAANKDPTAFAPGFSLVHHNLGKSFLGQKLPWSNPMNSEFNPPVVAALADYDHDHDLDLIITEPGSKLTVWRNNTPLGAHWLIVKPVDAHGPALNALVQVWNGGHVLERRIQTTTGFGAHVQGFAQFGLGTVKQLDMVRIWWPNGTITELPAQAADQTITVTMPKK